jgi:hypothetical protein
MTKSISPKYYRGKINATQFNHMSKMCPRMTDAARKMTYEFFVNGKLASEMNVSKQAYHQRAKYYMQRGVDLGHFPILTE